MFFFSWTRVHASFRGGFQLQPTAHGTTALCAKHCLLFFLVEWKRKYLEWVKRLGPGGPHSQIKSSPTSSISADPEQQFSWQLSCFLSKRPMANWPSEVALNVCLSDPHPPALCRSISQPSVSFSVVIVCSLQYGLCSVCFNVYPATRPLLWYV